MISASYNQIPNATMRDYTNYMNNGMNVNSKMKAIDPAILRDYDLNFPLAIGEDPSILTSRLSNLQINNARNSHNQMNNNQHNIQLRSNSVHNSPYERPTPNKFLSHTTSNTPLVNRMAIHDQNNMTNAPAVNLFNNDVRGNYLGMGHIEDDIESPRELIEYQIQATEMGFLVGKDLEDVLNKSANTRNTSNSRITHFFKTKHGSTNNHSSQQYLVIGVRVPTKEHVSEIVGKEGKKIKSLRSKSGALIATPNEKEDHVFLIEALPSKAIEVAKFIQQASDRITSNRLGNGIPNDRSRTPPGLSTKTALFMDTIGVPQRLVGKVIGTQGSIITTVQKETGTEIKSPPKNDDRAPGDTAIFEITIYDNGTVSSRDAAIIQIHRAKQLIAHLVMRVWEQQPRNATPSSDDGAVSNNSYQTPEWLWDNVRPMEDADAKEVIDRILRTSKNKIQTNPTTEMTNTMLNSNNNNMYDNMRITNTASNNNNMTYQPEQICYHNNNPYDNYVPQYSNNNNIPLRFDTSKPSWSSAFFNEDIGMHPHHLPDDADLLPRYQGLPEDNPYHRAFQPTYSQYNIEDHDVRDLWTQNVDVDYANPNMQYQQNDQNIWNSYGAVGDRRNYNTEQNYDTNNNNQLDDGCIVSNIVTNTINNVDEHFIPKN